MLKDGRTYYNVKAYPAGGVHRIQFANRQFITVPNAQIGKIRIGAVNWPAIQKPPITKPAEKKSETLNKESAVRWNLGPVIKSSILPGWGQLSLEHYGRSAFFFSTSALALGQYWTFRTWHAEAQEAYSEQATPILLAQRGNSGYLIFASILQQEKKVLLEREYQTNTMVGVLSLLWGWNVLDALVISNPHVARKYPALEYLRFGLEPFSEPGTRRGRWQAAVKFSF